MSRSESLCQLRDWFFKRMVEFLKYGDWKVEVINMRRLKSKVERKFVGLTNWDNETIYLDKRHTRPEILIHEVGHVFFEEILGDEARSKPRKIIGRIKGQNKIERWKEIQVIHWEKYFFGSLTEKQKNILQQIIDQAVKKKRP